MSAWLLTLRVALSLACVLGLIWYAQRRLGGLGGGRRPSGPELSVVGRQSLGRHTGVAVLAAGDRRLLLGVSDQGVVLLTELDRVESGAVQDVKDGSAGTAGPTSAAARLLARLPVQREEIDVASLAPSGAQVVTPAPPEVSRPSALDGSILSPSTWRRAARSIHPRAVHQ
jgi:flagellar protein FliO/FliZ